MNIFLVLAYVAFAFIATLVWGMIVDRTIRRPPSEWLASACLALFGGILVTCILSLDTIRNHLLISAGILGLLLFVGLLSLLWRKVKILDQEYFAKRSARLR